MYRKRIALNVKKKKILYKDVQKTCLLICCHPIKKK